MILITGGTCQGKKEFAKKEFLITDADIVSGKKVHDVKDISGYKAVSDYEYIVRHNLESGIDSETEYKALRESNPDIIIIASEVGCGIIPMEESENTFREETGSIMCIAARDADAVYKVVCGIAKKIK